MRLAHIIFFLIDIRPKKPEKFSYNFPTLPENPWFWKIPSFSGLNFPSFSFHKQKQIRSQQPKKHQQRMASKSSPDLKKYVEKRVSLKLNANRKVLGILRGFDQFMNLVLEDAEEVSLDSNNSKTKMGMIVIRGSSIQQMECLDAVD
jgi:small nuclear ribonucleoprotein G